MSGNRIKKLSNKTYKMFLSNKKEDKKKSLLYVNKMGKYAYNNFLSSSELKHILNLERKLLSTTGTYKSMIEERIYFILGSLVELCMMGHEGKVTYFDRIDKKEIRNNDKMLIIFLISESLIEFFYFKKERDTFSTKRKIMVIELLTNISCFYKQKIVYELSLICLKSQKKRVVTAGNYLKIAYLSDYTPKV